MRYIEAALESRSGKAIRQTARCIYIITPKNGKAWAIDRRTQHKRNVRPEEVLGCDDWEPR